MADYRLSRRADADLEDIAFYGIETFGIDQALCYRDGLKARFARIAEAPHHYPRVAHIRPGYRRSVYKSHTIYYQMDEDGVLIVRVLGRQDPETSLMEE